MLVILRTYIKILTTSVCSLKTSTHDKTKSNRTAAEFQCSAQRHWLKNVQGSAIMLYSPLLNRYQDWSSKPFRVFADWTPQLQPRRWRSLADDLRGTNQSSNMRVAWYPSPATVCDHTWFIWIHWTVENLQKVVHPITGNLGYIIARILTEETSSSETQQRRLWSIKNTWRRSCYACLNLLFGHIHG
jgi:hypothetical protein